MREGDEFQAEERASGQKQSGAGACSRLMSAENLGAVVAVVHWDKTLWKLSIGLGKKHLRPFVQND